MGQKIELSYGKILFALMLVLIIPSGAFVATTIAKTSQIEVRTKMLEETQKSKVDNDVLFQYMKMFQERYEIQGKLNEANKGDYDKIIEKLNSINEQIHKLEIQMIGYESFRGVKKKWNYEALLCFAWERGIYFKN